MSDKPVPASDSRHLASGTNLSAKELRQGQPELTHVIWKFKLEITDVQTLQLPEGAEILSVQSQFGADVTLWAFVNPTARKTRRTFGVYGTGHPMGPNPGTFIGTVITNGGQLVWHVFEAPSV